MKQRMITGIIAAVLFIAFVWYGGQPFTWVVYALAFTGFYELVRMKHIQFVSVPTALAAFLLFIMLLPSTVANNSVLGAMHLSKTEITFLIVLLLLSYTVLSKNTFTFDDASFLLMATLYIGMGFYYLNETRIAGLEYIFYTLLVIWATDSGAYFIGRAIGKRKLWPDISPNKTVGGAVGGIICGIAIALLYNYFVTVSDSFMMLIVVTTAVSVFGQIGDLVESAFKRHYGVKDSGRILPGHGGILDRLDSLMFVLPLLHFLQFI